MGKRWIAVTGFDTTENPDPGLAVIRALRAADPSWRVLALARDAWGTGAFARDLIDAVALVPDPAAGPKALLGRLSSLAKRQRIDVVIPTTDAELPPYVTIARDLRRLGIRTCLPSPAALRAREKRRLPSLGRRAGVLVPRTVAMTSEAVAERASRRLGYPQVLKGCIVDSTIAHTPEDLRVAARDLGSVWGWPVLAQPVVPGEEYGVAVLARRGEVLGAAAMKKLGVTNKGTAWAGVTVEEPELVELAGRLAKSLRWDGLFEAEFMRTAHGETWCFEINPVAPSWITLAAAAGANLPAELVRLALGERVDPVRAKPGMLFARALDEVIVHTNELSTLNDRQPGPHVGTGRVLALPTPAPRQGKRPTRGRSGGVVAITGLSVADNPSPGLSTARALRAVDTPPRLLGLAHEVLATGAYLDDIWDEVGLVPFPSREDGDYGDRVIEHCRRAGVDYLMPTLDVEIPVITALVPRLRAAGIRTLLPSPDALQAVAKPRLPELAANGFTLPRTISVPWLDAVDRVVKTLGPRFVIKGPAADAKVVRTAEEARVVARRLASTWGYPLIAQEHIDGQEYGIAAVADRQHRVVGVVTVRKEIRTLNGNTWGGTAVVDAELTALARRFARALRWVGPFELEVIRHPRRGPFLIEVNPRFPAWIYLAAGTGANLPWAAVRIARGERVGPLTTKPGAFYARMAWDVIAPVERMGTLAVDGMVAAPRARHGAVAARTRRAYEPMALTPHAFGAVNKYSGIAINTRAPQVPTSIVGRIEGCAVPALLREFGSPLFVVSRTRLAEEFHAFRDAFRARYADTEVAYSYRTNYLTAIRAALHAEGAWAEVVSGLEYEMARRLGVPGAHIVFNGPYKRDEDLRRAVGEGALVNVESFDELTALEEAAAAVGRVSKIGLRVTVRATPAPSGKCGFSAEAGLADEACRRAAASRRVRLAGLHVDLGTDLTDPASYRTTMETVAPLMQRYEQQHGIRWERLDLGGGFPNRHRYVRGRHGMMPEQVFPEFADAIVRPLGAALRRLERRPRLVLEPGRAIVEHPVFLLTTVVAVKRLTGGAKAAVLDAGVHLLPTACYTALDVAPTERAPLSVEEVTLFGTLGMQIDCLASGLRLPPLRWGAHLVVKNCGTYADSQSIQFSHARPAVGMVSGRRAELVREAETVDDVIGRDRVPTGPRARRSARPS